MKNPNSAINAGEAIFPSIYHLLAIQLLSLSFYFQIPSVKIMTHIDNYNVVKTQYMSIILLMQYFTIQKALLELK